MPTNSRNSSFTHSSIQLSVYSSDYSSERVFASFCVCLSDQQSRPQTPLTALKSRAVNVASRRWDAPADFSADRVCMYKSTHNRTPSSPHHLLRQNIFNRYIALNTAKSRRWYKFKFYRSHQFSSLRSISGVLFTADRSVRDKTVASAHFPCYKSINCFSTLCAI